jgi:hypothetical protein
MIFFPGDQVRTKDGATGKIENFTYDNDGWARGEANDVANVRTGQGDLIAVPCTELEIVVEAVAS